MLPLVSREREGATMLEGRGGKCEVLQRRDLGGCAGSWCNTGVDLSESCVHQEICDAEEMKELTRGVGESKPPARQEALMENRQERNFQLPCTLSHVM